MRLSIDSDDPGHAAYVSTPGARGARVFLDGIERTRVITADEEGRMIVRHCTDESGHCYLNAAGTDTAQETLFGTVRIELAP